MGQSRGSRGPILDCDPMLERLFFPDSNAPKIVQIGQEMAELERAEFYYFHLYMITSMAIIGLFRAVGAHALSAVIVRRCTAGVICV